MKYFKCKYITLKKVIKKFQNSNQRVIDCQMWPIRNYIFKYRRSYGLNPRNPFPVWSMALSWCSSGVISYKVTIDKIPPSNQFFPLNWYYMDPPHLVY